MWVPLFFYRRVGFSFTPILIYHEGVGYGCLFAGGLVSVFALYSGLVSGVECE